MSVYLYARYSLKICWQSLSCQGSLINFVYNGPECLFFFTLHGGDILTNITEEDVYIYILYIYNIIDNSTVSTTVIYDNIYIYIYIYLIT